MSRRLGQDDHHRLPRLWVWYRIKGTLVSGDIFVKQGHFSVEYRRWGHNISHPLLKDKILFILLKKSLTSRLRSLVIKKTSRNKDISL